MRKKLDKKISRRAFLRGAVAGMVLLGPGVPYIARRAWAAEEEKIGWHGPYPYIPPKAGFNARYDNAKIIKVYDSSNADLVKELVPDLMIDFLKKPENWGPFKMNEMEYIKYVPGGAGYVAATEKYRGTCKIGPKGELQNWVAGQPFENPQTGLEVIYNFDKRYQDDDLEQPSVAIVTEKGGKVKHYMDVTWRRLYLVGRTEVDPKPIYPNDLGLELMDSYGYLNPYDMKGLIPLYYRYTDPFKADDSWLYIPSMRRTRRLSTAQRMDSIGGGGDATWDDFQNFSGKILQYNWKLVGRREALLPTMAKGKAEWVEGRFIAAVNDRYRRVNAYILECIPKDPNHIYSKKTLWVDPESWHMPYGEYYDRKNKLWKIFNFHISFDAKGTYFPVAMYCIDVQRMHSTIYVVKGNSGNNGWSPHTFSWEALWKEFPAAR